MTDKSPHTFKEFNMFLSVGLCVLWAATFSLASSNAHTLVKGESGESSSVIADYIVGERSKRTAIGMLGKGVMRGIEVAKALLSDARLLYAVKSKQHTMYVKTGDYRTAVKDFYSARPSNIEAFQLPGGVKGKAGEAGDRIITIQTYGETGNPTMKIIQGLSKTNEKVDTIVYMN